MARRTNDIPEIEVTPEMIEATFPVWARTGDDFTDWGVRATAIYTAMELVRRFKLDPKAAAEIAERPLGR